MKESKEEIFFYSSYYQDSKSLWYLDSGCNNHMTCDRDRDLVVDVDENITSQIILGDGSQRSAEGKGTIVVRTKEGNQKLITGVLYMPNLSHNLLSVGQHIQKNFLVHFDDGRYKILDKKKNVVFTNIEMRNKTFPLMLSFHDNHTLKVESADSSYLWHLHYGHLYNKGLQLLKEKIYGDRTSHHLEE